MSQFLRPCINCGGLSYGDRCATHQRERDQQKEQARKPKRNHYKGDYAKRAKIVRESATSCWICGQGYKQGDPFQADHIVQGEPASPLAAAHRSCNIRRTHSG